MNLNLKNPIVFFDLETTGTNIVTDRIVELSYLKIYPDGKEESQTFLVNPTIPIPPNTTEIHGISDEDVKDAPTFNELAKPCPKLLRAVTWPVTIPINLTYHSWQKSFCVPV
jgi:DNA polymerase-3 subunit epsilon